LIDHADIVGAAQRGDLRAFGTLVERFQDAAYAVAYARVGDAHLAEDVTQEAMIEAHLKLPGLREPASFGAWLRRIVITHCNRMMRKKQPQNGQVEVELRLASREPSPRQRLERAELWRCVERVLQSLPPAQREATVLFYLREKSVAQVADILGIDPSAVKKRLHDARRKLEAKLINLVEETLVAQRPSRDRRLVGAVQLCNACIAGNLSVARQVLRADPSLVACHGEVDVEHMRRIAAHDGWTPLHLAAHYGHLEIVKLLVERGAEIEAVSRNSIGNTPLSAAAFGNRFDVVNYLLDRGARIEAPNAHGKTALDRATESGHTRMAELLRSRSAKHKRTRSLA
jgi:RNA polymerase sigma factor (sigma-70 family)